jgi:CHAD domain-containing protein
MGRVRRGHSVEANFRRILPRLVRRYFRKGRAIARQSTPNEKLHRFRIRTKRIRYITELYEEVFEPQLRGTAAKFREIQQMLGELQDQVMLSAYFQRRLARLHAPHFMVEYRGVLERSRRRQEVLRNAFFRHWRRLEHSGFEQRLLARIKKPQA